MEPDPRYFVLLRTQSGGLIPLTPVKADRLIDILAYPGPIPLFHTEPAARAAALTTLFGREFGFEIFDLNSAL